jgi:hypothetical protein
MYPDVNAYTQEWEEWTHACMQHVCPKMTREVLEEYYSGLADLIDEGIDTIPPLLLHSAVADGSPLRFCVPSQTKLGMLLTGM